MSMNNFLRERRLLLGVLQSELAEQMGVSQQTIARWETTGQIPAKYLKDLAVSMGAQVEYFLPQDGTSEMTQRLGKGTSMEENESLPFGDVCIHFVGAPESDARYYPVTHGTMQRIEQELGDAGCGFVKSAPWFQFEALNNKWVAINSAQVERVTFIDDNVEAMTSYEHEEVYKAARQLWDRMPSAKEVSAEDYPYSKKLVEKVAKLMKPGEHESLLELEGVTCEFTSGACVRHILSKDAAGSLVFLFDAVEPHDILPGTYLSLSFPDQGRFENLRLGSLRMIEAPLQALNEATQAAI